MNEPRQPVCVLEVLRPGAQRRVLDAGDGQSIPSTPRLFNTLLYFIGRRWLGAALTLLTLPAHAQDEPPTLPFVIEEVTVTASRVDTNIQETPISVKAFSGDDLDLEGIDTGRELGIMVPNLVINPGPFGELGTSTLIRGLPGITTYRRRPQLLQRRLSAEEFRRDRARRGVAWTARDALRAQFEWWRDPDLHAPARR